MKNVQIVPGIPFFMEEVNAVAPVFDEIDYMQRLQLLVERLKAKSLSHVIVFADREHFANMDYLIGFEPRFEESVLIVDKNGICTLIVGNECMQYSYISPVKLTRVLYQNFSLQGQPRDKLRSLSNIFTDAGITAGSKIGMVGYKYFEQEHIAGDPERTFDVPAYLLEELYVAGCEEVINFTRELTGLPNGIRMTVRTAKEVAWAEYTACKTAGVIQRMLKNLRPGISELDLSIKGKLDFSPISVFPMANFGEKHCQLGIRSPDNRMLDNGHPCGLCYAIRGSLTSRVGIASDGEDSLKPVYEGVIDSFYKPFWSAIVAWYESIHIGASTGEVYDKVMDIIGAPKFGTVLNPGHYIGGDEWVNSAFARGSIIKIETSAHMQCDIIVSSSGPVMVGICEDGIVIADKKLRNMVAAEYPELWTRIVGRQKQMREVLGININDDVLPLSNLNGVYFPYMMDTGLIFTAK